MFVANEPGISFTRVLLPGVRQRREASMSVSAAPAPVAVHGKVVLPGDPVVEASSLGSASVIRVGTGLSEQGSNLVASRSGTVKVLAGRQSRAAARSRLGAPPRRGDLQPIGCATVRTRARLTPPV